MRSNQCTFWHAQTNGIHGVMANDECLQRAPKIGRKPCPRNRYNSIVSTCTDVDDDNGGLLYRRQDVYRIVYLKKKGLKISSIKFMGLLTASIMSTKLSP